MGFVYYGIVMGLLEDTLIANKLTNRKKYKRKKLSFLDKVMIANGLIDENMFEIEDDELKRLKDEIEKLKTKLENEEKNKNSINTISSQIMRLSKKFEERAIEIKNKNETLQPSEEKTNPEILAEAYVEFVKNTDKNINTNQFAKWYNITEPTARRHLNKENVKLLIELKLNYESKKTVRLTKAREHLQNLTDKSEKKQRKEVSSNRTFTNEQGKETEFGDMLPDQSADDADTIIDKIDMERKIKNMNWNKVTKLLCQKGYNEEDLQKYNTLNSRKQLAINCTNAKIDDQPTN